MPEIDWTERMTARARGYLAVAGIRHLLIGLACIFATPAFVSPAFDQIRSVLPIPVWGVLFLVNSGICLAPVFSGTNGTLARIGLIASAGSTAIWGGGFIAAIIIALRSDEQFVGPTGVIFALALVAKDLIVCRNPMRSPFEDLAQRILDAERG